MAAWGQAAACSSPSPLVFAGTVCGRGVEPDPLCTSMCGLRVQDGRTVQTARVCRSSGCRNGSKWLQHSDGSAGRPVRARSLPSTVRRRGGPARDPLGRVGHPGRVRQTITTRRCGCFGVLAPIRPQGLLCREPREPVLPWDVGSEHFGGPCKWQAVSREGADRPVASLVRSV